MKVVIAGGGTGGHIFPAVAVIEALRASGYDVDVTLIGTRRGLEGWLASRVGYKAYFIFARALPRRLGIGSVISVLAASIGFIQSLLLLLCLRPDAVIATGGYASAPCIVAARIVGCPIIMIEPNVIPGRTTRLLSRFVDEVALGFSEAVQHFRKGTNLRVTGIPTRLSLQQHTREEALEHLGLDHGRKTIFIFGGSRGASSINRAFIDAMRFLEQRDDLQFIVQTGQQDYDLVYEHARTSRIRIRVQAFFDDIGMAYVASDLVVCRAGAGTIAEITALGLPSILVPYPYAMAGHQQANAEMMVANGAAILIPDSELSGKRLADAIVALLEDPRGLEQMAEQARHLGRPDAAREIAADIVGLMKHRSRLSRLAAIIGEICSVR